jgi:inner membrane protein
MDDQKKPFSEKFTKGYTFKILMLIALILLLLIPLSMIRGLVNERGRTANNAESDIMEAWGKQLIEAGPVITIPGVRTERIRTETEKDGEKIEIRKHPFVMVIAPQKLEINTALKTEVRRRGIFSVPLFSGNLALSGSFEPSRALSDILPDEELFFEQADLVISLSSQKGIRKITQANFNNEELFFQPGNRGHGVLQIGHGKFDTGIHAALSRFENKEASFAINIEIQGGQFVRVLPLGQDTHVSITADWASPSFQGAFLPNTSNIGDTAFDAQWDISYLSRDIPLFWREDNGEHDYSDALFGVNFFRGIDTYSLNTRAVKYAILFLMVPFLTLFLLEIFAKRRIHPVPYLLSGIGKVVFYLLLLSLSEQMAFYTAYIIAAFAVTVMMTLYSRSLLPSWNKSWYMGLVVTISYFLLYAVLNAESYALLIGSIGSFVIVALIMFLTRKLDWYEKQE